MEYFKDDTVEIFHGQSAIVLLDVTTGRETLRVEDRDERVIDVCFSPDGKDLASRWGNSIRVCDVGTRKERFRLRSRDDWFHSLAYSPGGRALLIETVPRNRFAFLKGTVRFWDAATGKPVTTLHGESVSAIALSPDGRTVAWVNLADWEPSVHVQMLATRRELHELPLPQDYVSDLAFSPDNRTLAAWTRYDEGTVYLWELATGRELYRLKTPAHYASVRLAFSPESHLLALAEGNAGEIRVWDALTGREVYRQKTSAGGAVALFPGGKPLAVTQQAKEVLIWRLPIERWVQQINSRHQQLGERETLWTDLAGADAAQAARAIAALVAGGDGSAEFLKRRLRPVFVDEEEFSRLVRELDDDEFTVREAASRQLECLDTAALTPLRKAQRQAPGAEARRRLASLVEALDSPVVKPGPVLQGLRATQALEYIGTPQARRALQRLAKGSPEARLTQAAKASLERLARRPPSAP